MYTKNQIFNIISSVSVESGLESYVIGGFVRDKILNRESKDIDIVTVGSGIELAKKVAKQIGDTKVSVFKSFGTAMIKLKNIEIEFVGARKESYRRNSRKPIVENGSLQDDQLRRDFTINALAISLNKNNFGEIIDPFDGLADIQKKVLRTPLNPIITFSDDPLRMMRAVRFAAQLNFNLDNAVYQAIKENADRIDIVSQERITDELNKIVLSDNPSKGFILLESSGLLKKIFPELQKLKGVDEVDDIRHKDNFYHTIGVLENISKNTKDLWLRWAAILHDISKPETKKFVEGQGWQFHRHEYIGAKKVPKIFKRLKLPLNEKMKYVQKLVQMHLRPIVLAQEIVSDSAVRRLLFDAGDDIDDLMLLCEADITSKNENKVKRILENFKIVRQKLIELEEKDRIRNFQPPVSGELIMETFGISPSREIGIIKNAIKDAILDGEIQNDFDQAFKFMIMKGTEIGLIQKI